MIEKMLVLLVLAILRVPVVSGTGNSSSCPSGRLEVPISAAGLPCNSYLCGSVAGQCVDSDHSTSEHPVKTCCWASNVSTTCAVTDFDNIPTNCSQNSTDCSSAESAARCLSRLYNTSLENCKRDLILAMQLEVSTGDLHMPSIPVNCIEDWLDTETDRIKATQKKRVKLAFPNNTLERNDKATFNHFEQTLQTWIEEDGQFKMDELQFLPGRTNTTISVTVSSVNQTSELAFMWQLQWALNAIVSGQRPFTVSGVVWNPAAWTIVISTVPATNATPKHSDGLNEELQPGTNASLVVGIVFAVLLACGLVVLSVYIWRNKSDRSNNSSERYRADTGPRGFGIDNAGYNIS